MFVYFLRHADAEPEARTDFERPLSPKGEEQSRAIGKFCLEREMLPEKIYASTAVRALETAKIVGKLIEVDVEESPFLCCGMSPETGVEGLVELSHHNALMLVGHEPDFSELVGKLIGLKESDRIHLRKGSLTAISLPRIEAGCGVLQFSIPVKYMK